MPRALLLCTLSLYCEPGSPHLLHRKRCEPCDQPVKRSVLPQTRPLRRPLGGRRPPFHEVITDSRKNRRCHQPRQGCHAIFLYLLSPRAYRAVGGRDRATKRGTSARRLPPVTTLAYERCKVAHIIVMVDLRVRRGVPPCPTGHARLRFGGALGEEA